MSYTLLDFFCLLASICLFLYGMKVMSEGLQKVAGDRLRNILGVMTRNRVTGVLTGIVITALIQSSSASTVMVVSFVNAGLMSLQQAMAVIFGANVGTTVTTWIISAFSFEFSISDYSLVLLAIGVPMLFMKKSAYKSLGEFLIGFSLLFMGLDMISEYVPNLQENPEMLKFVTEWTSLGVWSVLIFFGLGIVFTMIAQSSAATFAITLIMCSQGWISFTLGCAIILGGNIGTTITPILASLSGNIAAKRTAMGHLLFNVFGVIWVLIVFFPFVDIVCNLVGYDAKVGGQAEKLPVVLAMFHTCFNVLNTFVLIGLVPQIERLVRWLMPDKTQKQQDGRQLMYIRANLVQTPEIAVLQAQKETVRFADNVRNMFSMVQELFGEEDEKRFAKGFEQIEYEEDMTDSMEIEIANYLEQVSNDHLSDETKQHIRQLMREVSELESIGDACFNLARIMKRRMESGRAFTQQQINDIKAMMTLCSNAMTSSRNGKELENFKRSVKEAYRIEQDINAMRNRLKAANIEAVNSHQYDYAVGTLFGDMVDELEKLGDYVLNVAEARHGL